MKKFMLMASACLMILTSYSTNPNYESLNVDNFDDEVIDTTEILEDGIVEIVSSITEGDRVDLSNAEVTDFYSDQRLTAEFPSYAYVDTTEGFVLVSSSDYGYELNIASFPLGIEPSAYQLIAKQFDSEILEATQTDTIIDGYSVKFYECRSLREYQNANEGRLYVLTNGDETIFLLEMSFNGVQWWPNHIRFHFEMNSSSSLDKRLANFNALFNNVFNKSQKKVEGIIGEDKITVSITDPTLPLSYSRKRMTRSFYKMIHKFTVFREFADLKYDFTIQFFDINGEKQIVFEFPYDDYSQWINGAMPDISEDEEDQ